MVNDVNYFCGKFHKMFHKVPNTPLAALRNVPYYLFSLPYLILLILFFLILFELLRTVSKKEVRKQPVEKDC